PGRPRARRPPSPRAGVGTAVAPAHPPCARPPPPCAAPPRPPPPAAARPAEARPPGRSGGGIGSGPTPAEPGARRGGSRVRQGRSHHMSLFPAIGWGGHALTRRGAPSPAAAPADTTEGLRMGLFKKNRTSRRSRRKAEAAALKHKAGLEAKLTAKNS